MILVTGASGNVGAEVVTAVAERGRPVRALVRDPARAAGTWPATATAAVEIVAGDLDEPETVVPALDGVDAVFLLGGFATLPELLDHMRRAGVAHVALLTSRCVVGGEPDNAVTRMWLDAEAAVRASRLARTFVRPSGFHSNALRWLPQLEAGDVVRTPWPDVAIASIDPADIAAVATTAMVDRTHDGEALSLSGPAALTPADQVAVLADVLDRPLRAEPLSDAEARAALLADTPAPVVDALFRFFSEGEFDDAAVVGTVAAVTGRPPRTFRQWVTAHADRFPGPGGPA
jgi:uncharacterized protein YbjT (DUF2867 family)